MKVERIDHIHIKCSDFEKSVKIYEELLGKEFLMNLDFTEEHGNLVAFEPYPMGIELMKGTANKGTGAITMAAAEGVFMVCLKVPDINEATAEMESMGYKLIERIDSGPIHEAIFDTKEAAGVLIELVEYQGDSMLEAFQAD